MLRRAAKGFAIAFAALLVVLFAEPTGPFQDLSNLTYDFTVDHAGLSSPSRDLVLIDVDEDTYQGIRQFPFPRSIMAELVRRVGAAKPRVIGLDNFLSEPRTPEDDKRMQEALTGAGVAVIASQAANGGLPASMPLPQFCQPENEAAISGFCQSDTPGAVGYAFVDLPIDPDGFIRTANLFSSGKVPAMSFPLMLAQQYARESIKPGGKDHAIFQGRNIIYENRDLQTILIGSWGREPATRFPAWKLLAGEVPSEVMKDKLVLIGQSNDASADTHLTPIYRLADKEGFRMKMGGTSILAAAIRTLLEGNTVRRTPRLAEALLVLVAGTGAATLLLACDLSLGLGCLLWMMAVMLGASLVCYAKMRLWLPFLPVEMSLALTLPFTLGVRFFEERVLSKEAHLQRQQLMGLFSSYVDPAVAETIWQRRTELSLGGEEHVATVMFTDIRNFTALSANQPPALVLGWLNRYVIAMDEVIRAHGGFLNKFIGDGLMIIFGLPLGHGAREDARRALEASLAMLERVEALNEERSTNPQLPHLRIGIGIHTGSLMAGSIGSANRQEYSVIGETVNLASRLESLNKRFETEILMSGATMELVSDLFPGLEFLGGAEVAGLQEPVPVYTLRRDAPPSETESALDENKRIQEQIQ